MRRGLSKIKLSKIRNIAGGTCVVMFPSGTLVDDMCCTIGGKYKNILRMVDACLDGNFQRLGITRDRFHLYIKNKVNIDYLAFGNDHILTIYTKNNTVVVFTFYCEGDH